MMLNGSSSSVGNGGNGVCKFPFTPSQWQELEHQALIFKFMVSNVPIPPDLLFTLKRSFLHSSSTSPHMGWSCFQMGLGLGMRKIDPEPGRCRRTDGKKWRCSKEAFHESKYCEKHMHRGKNRSRKHVEHQPQQQQQQFQLQHVLTSLSSTVTSDHNNKNNKLCSSGYCSSIHPYNHSTQLGLHSGVDRYENGHSNGGRMSNIKEYTPLIKFQGFEEYDESSRACEGGDYDDDGRTRVRRGEKTVYRFLEECPPDNNNNSSWLKLDDNKSSNCSSSSTTQLSISIPTSTSSTTSHHHHHHQLFPMFNSSTHF